MLNMCSDVSAAVRLPSGKGDISNVLLYVVSKQSMKLFYGACAAIRLPGREPVMSCVMLCKVTEQRLEMYCDMSAAIRLPSGGRLQRTFSKDDPVSALHDFCIVKVRQHPNSVIFKLHISMLLSSSKLFCM